MNWSHEPLFCSHNKLASSASIPNTDHWKLIANNPQLCFYGYTIYNHWTNCLLIHDCPLYYPATTYLSWNFITKDALAYFKAPLYAPNSQLTLNWRALWIPQRTVWALSICSSSLLLQSFSLLHLIVMRLFTTLLVSSYQLINDPSMSRSSYVQRDESACGDFFQDTFYT